MESQAVYATKKTYPTPKVDALAALLEHFSEAQLLQLAEKCERASYTSQNGQLTDVTIRFKDGRPRFMGVEAWEEVEK